MDAPATAALPPPPPPPPPEPAAQAGHVAADNATPTLTPTNTPPHTPEVDSSAASTSPAGVRSTGPAYWSMSDALRQRISGDAPGYPRMARNLERETVVVVRVRINRLGLVEKPIFLGGDPLFKTEVFRALQTWRFKPATLHGKTVAAYTTLRFAFKLSH